MSWISERKALDVVSPNVSGHVGPRALKTTRTLETHRAIATRALGVNAPRATGRSGGPR